MSDGLVYYLKIDDVDGSVTDTGYEKSSKISAYTWSFYKDIDLNTPQAREVGPGGQIYVGDFMVTKHIGAASVQFINSMCDTKKVFKTGTFWARKTEKKNVMTIKFTNIAVKGASLDNNIAKITFHFAKFEFDYQKYDENGNKDGGLIKASYDMRTEKVD